MVTETNLKVKPTLTPQMVETIEDILNRRRNPVELKVEQGKIKIIELKRQTIN